MCQVRLHCIVTCRPAAQGWGSALRAKLAPAATAAAGNVAGAKPNAVTLTGLSPMDLLVWVVPAPFLGCWVPCSNG